MQLTRLAVLCVLAPALTGCMFRPKAVPDSAVTFRGAAVDIPVLANDTDPRQRELTLLSSTASTNGQTKINADQTIKYIPNSDAIGEDVFSYRIKNTRGRTSSAEVTVTILEPQPGSNVAIPATPIQEPPKAAVTTADTSGTTDSRRAKPVEPATTPPPPVPVVPPSVVPSAAAALTGVSLTVFTREDDKDAGETVQVTIRRGDAVVAQRTVGGTEAWARQSDKTEEIEITPPLSAADASQLTLEVRKVHGLGAGESWVMQVDVQGRLSDGRTVMLVPRSLPFRYGGGSSNSRTWKMAPLPPAVK